MGDPKPPSGFLGKVFSPLYRGNSPQNFPSTDPNNNNNNNADTVSNASFSSQRSAQANSSFTSNTALAAWKGSSRTEVPDLSVGAPSAADHSKTAGAPSPPHHTPHKKGTAPQAVSVPVTPAVEQSDATAKRVSANACATHVSGYRKCLEVNPDAKMNCTWALDNYMKCQETLIE